MIKWIRTSRLSIKNSLSLWGRASSIRPEKDLEASWFMVYGLCFMFYGLWLWVYGWGLCFMVVGLGFGVQGLGLRVEG